MFFIGLAFPIPLSSDDDLWREASSFTTSLSILSTMSCVRYFQPRFSSLQEMQDVLGAVRPAFLLMKSHLLNNWCICAEACRIGIHWTPYKLSGSHLRELFVSTKWLQVCNLIFKYVLVNRDALKGGPVLLRNGQARPGRNFSQPRGPPFSEAL